MSGEVRVDRVEIELETLNAAQAQIVAAAIAGALTAQLASSPPPRPPRTVRRDGDDLDVEALAAEIAARILEAIEMARERNDEEAAWR